jgi:hypothetical protein
MQENKIMGDSYLEIKDFISADTAIATNQNYHVSVSAVKKENRISTITVNWLISKTVLQRCM